MKGIWFVEVRLVDCLSLTLDISDFLAALKCVVRDFGQEYTRMHTYTHTQSLYDSVSTNTTYVYIGPMRGICNCDRNCTCLPGWTGRACDCPISSDTCVSPLGVSQYCKPFIVSLVHVVIWFIQLPCSNRGNCSCGECTCNEDIFSGQFCEICTGSRAVSWIHVGGNCPS